MKLDKETVIKQRFWFLLPVFALCILIAWICVLGVRGATEVNYKVAKDKDNALKTIASTQELKNQSWIDAMIKELEVSTAKKDELWIKEFDRQNRVIRDPKDKTKFTRTSPYFFTWPEQTLAQWERTSQGRRLNDQDYGEYLGNIPSDEYRREYLGQFEGVVDVIHDWLDESNGNNVVGAVRVLGGRENHRRYVIPQLLSPFSLTADRHILSDEIYMLQEDIAVKREIFASLAELLNSYSQLKNEWYETPFVDIVEVAAPAAPAAPGAVVPPVASPTESTPAPKKDAEPEVYQKYRFYNYIWPNLLNAQEMAQDAKLKGALVDYGLPVIDPYKGWRIDLLVTQDEKDDKKLVLRGVSANHSNILTLPAQPFMIWYSELGSDKETATPLYLSDAGGVGPSEYWPNATLKKVSQKKLKDIPLPDKFGKITRISRVLPENTIDQQVVFNNDWAVHLQLVRRANIPNLLLRGEIINRSGRRIPVSTFTAGLTLPNDTKLLFEDFKVPTDAFNAGERKTFTQEIKNPVQPRSLSLVKQKLTWRSTPIKRIDRLEIGANAHAHSDRLKIMPLLPYNFKRKDPFNQNVTAVVPPAGGGGGGAADMGGGGAGAGTGGALLGGKPGGGGGGGGDASPNQGIPLSRYVEVSDQLRRIPVALVMIVDATAITDIIGAMSNSRLRFQVTMAPWTKVPNLGRPGGNVTAPSGGGSGGGANPPPGGGGGAGLSGGGGAGAGGGGKNSGGAGAGGAGGSIMGGGGGANPPPPGGGMGAGGQGGQGGATGGAPRPSGSYGLEDDSSVVELQIYGIVTVYESPDNIKRIEKQKASAPPTDATAGTTPPAK